MTKTAGAIDDLVLNSNRTKFHYLLAIYLKINIIDFLFLFLVTSGSFCCSIHVF